MNKYTTQHNKKKLECCHPYSFPLTFLFFWRRFFFLALKIYFASSNWRNISCLQRFVVDLIMRINVELKTIWLIYLKPLVSVPLCADMYAIDIHWHAKTTTCIVVIALHMEYYKAKNARIFTSLRTALHLKSQHKSMKFNQKSILLWFSIFSTINDWLMRLDRNYIVNG